MNWPPLSTKTSEIVADVLRDCARTRPESLFHHMAQALQERSGLDPETFEQHFEECRNKPRTYVLEDRVPAGQDPYAWVPMRYNDDAILLTLRRRASELITETLSALPIDTRSYLDRMCVAFPELLYISATPHEPVGDLRSATPAELQALQALRALYIGCGGCQEVAFDDESVEVSFLCEALAREARETLLQPARDPEVLETLVVFSVLRALGAHDAFRSRHGGTDRGPEEAVLRAIDNEERALPSFHRLSAKQKAIIKASLRAFFPVSMLVSTEAVPAQFAKAKEHLASCEGALGFHSCALVIDHMVRCRSALIRDDAVDFVRLATQCIASLETYSAPRAYEMFLKKRAERHSWRVVRDDHALKSIVRLCCLAGLDDTDAWNRMMSAVEQLPEREQEVLHTELGRKDGCVDSPAYVLLGAGEFMRCACSSQALGATPSLLFLARILEESSRHFDHTVHPNTSMVTIDMSTVARYVKKYTPGGAPFEDTAFSIEEAGPAFAFLRLAGDV